MNFLEHSIISNRNVAFGSYLEYSIVLLVLDETRTSNDFNVRNGLSIEEVSFICRTISWYRRHTRWLLARRTVPVPATRADRREINETRRQLQPLQPMLFQRIIDLSSDPSRSYANRAFTSAERCVPDGSMQSQNFHRCARCEIMRPLRAAARRCVKSTPW